MKNIFFPLVLLGYTAGASTVSLLEFDGSFEKTPIGVTSKFTHWSFYSPVKHIKTAIVADAPAELPVRKALFVDYTNAVASDNSRSFYSDYLPVDPQKNYRQSVPSLSQAQQLRKLDKEGKLNPDVIDGILSQEKKKEDRNVIINGAELEKYFGKDKSPREMKDQIIALLDDWKAKQPPELAKPQKKTEKAL